MCPVCTSQRARSQELWVDVAKANSEPSESSQNPLQHPPAGFGECPSPSSAAPGWEAGASPLCLVSGHGYGLSLGVWGVPSQRILGGLDQSWGAHLWSWGPALDMPTPHPIQISMGQCDTRPATWPAGWPADSLRPLQRVSCPFDFLSAGILCGRSP